MTYQTHANIRQCDCPDAACKASQNSSRAQDGRAGNMCGPEGSAIVSLLLDLSLIHISEPTRPRLI
eukprot:1097947-Amphidinium_carterae.1